MVNWALLFGFKLPTGLNNLFLLPTLPDPSGTVHPEITNKNGNPNYKYFYSNAEQGNPPSCLCPVKKNQREIIMVSYIFFFLQSWPAWRRHRTSWRATPSSTATLETSFRRRRGSGCKGYTSFLPPPPSPTWACTSRLSGRTKPTKEAPRCSRTSPQLQHNFARVSAPSLLCLIVSTFVTYC